MFGYTHEPYKKGEAMTPNSQSPIPTTQFPPPLRVLRVLRVSAPPRSPQCAFALPRAPHAAQPHPQAEVRQGPPTSAKKVRARAPTLADLHQPKKYAMFSQFA